jgi:hypothetical protein
MRNHIELLVGMSARSDAVTIITKLSTPNRMAEADDWRHEQVFANPEVDGLNDHHQGS